MPTRQSTARSALDGEVVQEVWCLTREIEQVLWLKSKGVTQRGTLVSGDETQKERDRESLVGYHIGERNGRFRQGVNRKSERHSLTQQ